jgi:hypothetical protein
MNSTRQAGERSQSAIERFRHPIGQIAHAPTCDQVTETLQQSISTSQPFIFMKNPVECVALDLVEFIRWTET